MRQQIILSILICGFLNSLIAQHLTFSQFPSNWQLYQRDLTTNRASVPLVFTVAQSSGYTKLEARLFDESGATVSVVARQLSYTGGKSEQNFTIEIPAKCNNHRLEIHCFRASSNTWVLEKTAVKLLAGDIFIINGQSNAQAGSSPHLSDIDEYTRSWHPPYGWGTLNLSFPGMWGARIANRIADDIGIPVAIFNQAVGALTIDTYLKNPTNPMSGNYGSLLKRFDDAGLPRRARTVIWFHGEADAWSSESAPYIQHYQNLLQSWKSDYQIERAFLFQMRYQSCTSPRPFILEAHRQCGNLPGVDIMSTTNAHHDSCHFYYQNGYRVLGDRMFDLIANRFYGRNVPDVMAPTIERAYISGNQEITIETKHASALQVIGSPWSDFRTEGASVPIVGGAVVGTRIVLQLGGSMAGVSGISYLGHPGGAPDWIVNPRGVGLMAWHNVALVANPNGGNTGVLTFLPPSDISVTAPAGATAAIVTFPMPAAQSTCLSGATVSQISGPVSGSQFPVGTTQVCFRAIDACGNQQTRCFNVVVTAGSGGNPSPDCSQIGIQAGIGQIIVSQLHAPITAIQVFDNQWAQRYTCFGNCQTPNQVIPNLTAGRYFVKVDFLNANWQPICKKEAYVVVTTTFSPPSQDSLVFPQPQHLTVPTTPGSNSAVVHYTVPAASSTCTISQVTVSQISGLPSGSSFPVGTTQLCFIAKDGCNNTLTRCFNVEVTATPPPAPKIDLELSGSSTVADPAVFTYFSVKFTLRNKGNLTAKQIVVKVNVPSNVIYQGGSEFQVSAGNFRLQTNEWRLASLAAGDSAVLTLHLFNLKKNTKILYAQVAAAEPTDADSTPNNGNAPNVGEDDEVAVPINAVNAPPPPPNPSGVDLELELKADVLSPGQWKHVTLTLTLKNRGNLPATDVAVRFMNQSLPDLWSKLAYVSHVVPAGTTFDHWLGLWHIPTVAAGQSFVLTYAAFTRVANTIDVFAEVAAASGNDLDSKPGNSVNEQAAEDDEVKIILNRSSNILVPGDRQHLPVHPVEAKNWQVFPNPAGEQLYIHFDEAVSETLTVSIFDISGTVRYSSTIQVHTPQDYLIDLSAWQNGLYYLQISSPGLRPVTQKVMIARTY